MTKADRIRFGKLTEMGCILCRHLGTPGTPPEIHHLRSGQGMSQRAPHDLTIPLCAYHHRSSEGYHGLGRRGFEATYGVSEADLLAMVNQILFPNDGTDRPIRSADIRPAGTPSPNNGELRGE